MSDQLSPLPLPKTLLHYICFICLVGWGASAIAVASHVGTMAPWLEWARELASQFFFGLLAFGFFYIQFVAVERFAARELNFTFGHIQVLGGLALFLVGIVRDAAALILNAPQFGSNGLGSTLLFYICVLGEGMLLANVVVTYALPQGVAAARPAALVARSRLRGLAPRLRICKKSRRNSIGRILLRCFLPLPRHSSSSSESFLCRRSTRASQS